MEIIKSISNKKIQLVKRVLAGKEKGLFIFEGRHIISEAIYNEFPLKCVLLREDINPIKEIASPVFIIEKNLFKKISITEASEGIIAIGKERWEHKWKPNPNSKTLFLEGIQDPINMGILMRSAVAFGFKNILLDDKSCSPYNSKAIMRSGGAIFRVSLCRNEVIKTIEACILNKIPVFASFPKVRCNQLGKFQNYKGLLLALGNEGTGLSDCWKDKKIISISIPMTNEAESLNVSAAGSLLMFLLSDFRLVQASS